MYILEEAIVLCETRQAMVVISCSNPTADLEPSQSEAALNLRVRRGACWMVLAGMPGTHSETLPSWITAQYFHCPSQIMYQG